MARVRPQGGPLDNLARRLCSPLTPQEGKARGQLVASLMLGQRSGWIQTVLEIVWLNLFDLIARPIESFTPGIVKA